MDASRIQAAAARVAGRHGSSAIPHRRLRPPSPSLWLSALANPATVIPTTIQASIVKPKLSALMVTFDTIIEFFDESDEASRVSSEPVELSRIWFSRPVAERDTILRQRNLALQQFVDVDEEMFAALEVLQPQILRLRKQLCRRTNQ